MEDFCLLIIRARPATNGTTPSPPTLQDDEEE
jgi:hypothetical protein